MEPLVPARILDTRSGNGAPTAPLGPGASLDLQVTGRGGVPPTGVGAVVLNVTATGPTAATHLTVWPKGATRPEASNLNLTPGQTAPNLVIAKIGVDGKISIYNNTGNIHVIADVAGWFPDAGGNSTTIQPWADTTLAGTGDIIARTGNSESGGTIELATSADLPTVGGHLAVLPNNIVPEGMTGEVTNITGRVATLAPSTIEEVFADYEAHSTGPFGQSAGIDATVAAPSAQVGWDFELLDNLDCGGGLPPLTTLSLSFGNPDVQFDFDLSERYVKFLLTTIPSVTASGAWNTNVSCSFTFELAEVPIPGSPGLFFVPTVSGSVSAGGSGAATAFASAPVAIGFEVDHGDATNLSDADLNGLATFDPLTDASLTVAASLGAEIQALGILGVGINFGMEAEAFVRPAADPCVAVTLGPKVSATASLEKWGVGWNVSLDLWKGEPAILYEAHPIPPCLATWAGTIQIDYDLSATHPCFDVTQTRDVQTSVQVSSAKNVFADPSRSHIAHLVQIQDNQHMIELTDPPSGPTITNVDQTSIAGELPSQVFSMWIDPLAPDTMQLNVSGGIEVEQVLTRSDDNGTSVTTTYGGYPLTQLDPVPTYDLPIDPTHTKTSGTISTTKPVALWSSCDGTDFSYGNTNVTLTWDLELVQA